MKTFSDNQIVESWRKNVSPWVKAIQNKEIESRRLVTDQAILETISSIPAKNALDIGCGEGWLVRELSARGISTTGIDAI
ncbi:MAG: class I SAM-dependent methyltransferase, partial [Amphritea sp.]|nr:class I SAM-dependent methyltransferase [Amphritea sp.]